MLVKYLQSINPDIITGVLLLPSDGPLNKKQGTKKTIVESPSKPLSRKGAKMVKPKKIKQSELPPIVVQKLDSKPLITEVSQLEAEVIPPKTGVLRRLKKLLHRPSNSPERSDTFSLQFTMKHHVTSKGVMIREVRVPVSPASRKRVSKDIEKKISKKRRRLILEDSQDDLVVQESPLMETYIPSPTKHSGGDVETSNVDTTIILGDSTKVSAPEQTIVTNPKVTDKTSKDQGNTDLIVSSSFKTLTIDTTTSLHPFVSKNTTVTYSPTYENIIKKPITS